MKSPAAREEEEEDDDPDVKFLQLSKAIGSAGSLAPFIQFQLSGYTQRDLLMESFNQGCAIAKEFINLWMPDIEQKIASASQ